MTWLGLTRFTRLTQRSQGQKAKPVYLKELLEFGAWNLFLRLGLTSLRSSDADALISMLTTDDSVGSSVPSAPILQMQNQHNLRLTVFQFIESLEQAR